jgi:hypothetical protein
MLAHDYLIALVDGVPAGYIKYSVIEHSSRRPRVYAWQTFVRVPFRTKGVAEALTKRLAKNCYTRGITLLVGRKLADSIIRQTDRFIKDGKKLPFSTRVKKFPPHSAILHIPARAKRKVRNR